MAARPPHALTGSLALAAAVLLARPGAVLGQASAPHPKADDAKAIYDEHADAAKEVDAALARARRENKRVLVQWGANWCGWCRLLHATCAEDDAIRHELLYEYEVVLVDVGRFDRNLELAERFHADFRAGGVPYLTVLDGDGTVLANQETGSLELKNAEKPGHDTAKVLAFLKAHEAAPRSAAEVLAGALERASREEKLVFLHFGAPWCGWCHRLDDWLTRPDVAERFGRAFVDVKIDVDRMTGGKEAMARYDGAKDAGLPWFVVLDGTGAVRANSNIIDGRNVGCPWSEAEIAAFGELLGKVSHRLTAEDVAALTATMGPPKPAS